MRALHALAGLLLAACVTGKLVLVGEDSEGVRRDEDSGRTGHDDDTGQACIDADGDGACVSEDCDDGDATIRPGAPEVCNGIDDDCDDTDASVMACLETSPDDGSICASLPGSDDGLVPPWTGACDTSAGYASWGDHCNFAVAVHTTWPDARASCLAAGGYLATVTSTRENTFIHTLNSRPYLGACDADVEGTWTWITGETWSWTNWDRSEPNDSSPGEDGLEFSGTANLWNDIWYDHHSYGAGYVCEFEGVSPEDTGTADP